MSNNSLASLLQWMQGKSVTHGWNALVTYNRNKVNRLMEQQYISQFNQDSFLPPIYGSINITPNGEEVLDLVQLVLSAPRISFETADLLNSRAVLTMDIVSGSVSLIGKPDGFPTYLRSSFKIGAQQEFKLNMDVDLAAVSGSVDQQGEVVLDIAEGYNFRSNLLGDGNEQYVLGGFFKDLFERQPLESRRYVLGVLDYLGDDMLTPSNFYIRTQAAPSGKNINSDDYGDGGVVLFVRTKNDFYDGELPSPGNVGEFRYLIPDDRDGGSERFSGAVILSSRMIFDHVLKPYLINHIGRGLALRSNAADGSATALKATNGKWDAGDVHFTKQYPAGRVANFMMYEVYFPFHPTFSVASDGSELSIVLNDSIRLDYHFKYHQPGWWDENTRDYVEFSYSYKLIFEIVPDGDMNPGFDLNKITFRLKDSSDESSFTINNYPEMEEAQDVREQFERFARGNLTAMKDLFFSIQPPDIDFHAINHLLFPNYNALLIKESYLPGDVALFGQMNPTHTSFTLNPLYSTIKVGDRQKFEIEHLSRSDLDITWSVRGIDGSRAQGDIEQDGWFTAPPLERLEGAAVRNVITATYTDPETGEERTASALAVVVAESMAVSPAIATVSLNKPSAPIVLRASSLGGAPLKWTPLGNPPLGTLTVSADTYSATYTPPASPQPEMVPEVFEIEDTVTKEKVFATVLLLSRTYALGIEPSFHPGIPRGAAVQLEPADDWAKNAGYQWSVVTGEGRVDQSGLFTAPDDEITSPYSVVECRLLDGSGNPIMRGFSVIHLSNLANRANWHGFNAFTIKTESGSKRLFANGLQQVKVRVAIKVIPLDGTDPVSLTPSELTSMCLVVANTTEVLPFVGAEGVPEGSDKRWGVNKKENGFAYYPAPASAANQPGANVPTDLDGDGKWLYIQTRDVTELRIAVRVTRADGAFYYSTDNKGGEEEDNIIKITPEVPPTYSDGENGAYKFTRQRVEGEEDNDDYDLNTVDYYYLELKGGNEQKIPFRSVEFQRALSTVQWESEQYAEEMASYTGFAMPRSSTLEFEPLLYNAISPAAKPSKIVVPGYESPEGVILFSLHRRMDLPFDANSEFAQPVKMKLFDEYGNQHDLQIKFKSPKERNELVVRLW